MAIPTEGPDGTIYPSRMAAAAALGVSNSTICTHLKRFGHLKKLQPGNRTPLPNTAKPVKGPDGTIYASKREAQEKLGISDFRLREALRKSPDGQTIVSLEDASKPHWRLHPVSYRGRDYGSILAFCLDIGCSRATVWRHLDRYGTLDNIRPRGQKRRGNLKGRASNSVPYAIGPYVFPSIVAAAHELGCSTSLLARFLDDLISKKGKRKLAGRLARYDPKKPKEQAYAPRNIKAD